MAPCLIHYTTADQYIEVQWNETEKSNLLHDNNDKRTKAKSNCPYRVRLNCYPIHNNTNSKDTIETTEIQPIEILVNLLKDGNGGKYLTSIETINNKTLTTYFYWTFLFFFYNLLILLFCIIYL